MKTLDVSAIFKSEAEDILKARKDSIRIHCTDIRAAGNEVEVSVRNFLKRMLPSRYYVTHGHLIDVNGEVSSELDTIIADNMNLPSLMTTKDGTEYIPIDSVYAIGEIKSTYYRAEKYIESFSEVLEDIKGRLFHDQISNTAFNGVNSNTLLRDIVLARGNRTLNRIYSFNLFVDGGDFDFEDIAQFYINRPRSLLPDIAVLLTLGMIVYGALRDNRFEHTRYPDETEEDDHDWYFSPFQGDKTGSLEGNHLGILYYNLLEHLSNSYLEPPSLRKYTARMMVGRKSLLKKAKTT